MKIEYSLDVSPEKDPDTYSSLRVEADEIVSMLKEVLPDECEVRLNLVVDDEGPQMNLACLDSGMMTFFRRVSCDEQTPYWKDELVTEVVETLLKQATVHN